MIFSIALIFIRDFSFIEIYDVLGEWIKRYGSVKNDEIFYRLNFATILIEYFFAFCVTRLASFLGIQCDKLKMLRF